MSSKQRVGRRRNLVLVDASTRSGHLSTFASARDRPDESQRNAEEDHRIKCRMLGTRRKDRHEYAACAQNPDDDAREQAKQLRQIWMPIHQHAPKTLSCTPGCQIASLAPQSRRSNLAAGGA